LVKLTTSGNSSQNEIGFDSGFSTGGLRKQRLLLEKAGEISFEAGLLELVQISKLEHQRA